METYVTSQTHPVDSYFNGLFRDLLLLFPSKVNELETDRSWLLARLQQEGCESMIPKLSALGKAFERALITSDPFQWDRDDFEVRPQGLPVFLGSLFSEVLHLDGTPIFKYDAIRGVFLDSDGFFFPMPREVCRSCADFVIAIRQALLFYSKVEDLPVLADEADEVRSFVTRVTVGKPILLEHRTDVLYHARKVLADLLMPEGCLHASLAQWLSEPFGAHGPGSVFDGSRGKDKWRFSGYAGVDERLFCSQYPHISLADPLDLASSRVLESKLCIVPKDFRAHRLICIETKEAMFAQQGLRTVLESIISNDACASSCINFRDQGLSMRKSTNLRFSTIDLKDASDGISLELAKLLLPLDVFRILTRYRSRRITLPDGQEIPAYRTLFTMGNALCFPTETLIFWALCMGVILSKDTRSIGKVKQNLRVFGDDIIVDARHSEEICAVLSEAGLSVNFQKYCHNTLVRESCGSWNFGTIDSRITKTRIAKPQQLRDWVSSVATARLLHLRGFEHAALSLLECIQDIYPVPYGFFGLPGQRDCKRKAFRYNVQLQRLEYCMPVIQQESRPAYLDGLVGIYSYFTNHGSRTVDHGDAPRVEWSWESVETDPIRTTR